MKLCESSVTFSEIFDFVLPIKRVALNVKLSTLVVVASAHHWIHCWHVLACIRIVWVVHWNYEVIHLLLKNLFAGGILDIPASGSRSIIGAFLIIIGFGSIFDAEVGESVEFLSSWSVFITYKGLSFKVVILLVG